MVLPYQQRLKRKDGPALFQHPVFVLPQAKFTCVWELRPQKKKNQFFHPQQKKAYALLMLFWCITGTRERKLWLETEEKKMQSRKTSSELTVHEKQFSKGLIKSRVSIPKFSFTVKVLQFQVASCAPEVLWGFFCLFLKSPQLFPVYFLSHQKLLN